MLRTLSLLLLLAFSSLPALSAPPQPEHSLDPEKCRWQWQEVQAFSHTVGMWTEACDLDPHQRIAPDRSLPGFVLTIGNEPVTTVIHVLKKQTDADPTSVLATLRSAGLIPDDDDCQLRPASTAALSHMGPTPRTTALLEIMPTGNRLAALESTPPDQVPEPPCGEYGWSTHGVRVFLSDLRHPDLIIYMNLGEDGMLFDPHTLTVE